MARPSTYHEGIPDLVREYVNTFEEIGDTLPTVEGLAAFLEKPRSRIYAWADEDDKAEFRDTLDELKAKQRKMLFEKGLLGEYNPTIAKLGLSANHGMVEKSAQEGSGPDGGPVAVTTTKIVLVSPDD